MPSTRCARRERAHRQGSARAGAALQRDVARPSAALRDDGGACCGHTATRMVLRRRQVRRSAAAGRCGTAGGSAAERPSWATARSCAVRASALTPFQRPLLFLGGPPSPPRHAQQAVRSGCCAGQLTVRAPARVRVVFADGAQVRARDGESKWALRVALLEAIDISSMDDKMLMEELLNNTAWSSTRVLQTDSSEMFLAMYGLVSLVLIGTITLNISSILSCLSRVGGDRRAQQHGDASDGGRRF